MIDLKKLRSASDNISSELIENHLDHMVKVNKEHLAQKKAKLYNSLVGIGEGLWKSGADTAISKYYEAQIFREIAAIELGITYLENLISELQVSQ